METSVASVNRSRRMLGVIACSGVVAVLALTGIALPGCYGDKDRQTISTTQANPTIDSGASKTDPGAEKQLARWDTLNLEAMALLQKGDTVGAETIAKNALALSEAAMGPDHPDVAAGLNNLAAIYRAAGRYMLAEPLYKAWKLVGAVGPLPLGVRSFWMNTGRLTRQSILLASRELRVGSVPVVMRSPAPTCRRRYCLELSNEFAVGVREGASIKHSRRIL